MSQIYLFLVLLTIPGTLWTKYKPFGAEYCFKIDFNVPQQQVPHGNCTTIIKWTGSSNIRLIPKIIQTNTVFDNLTNGEDDPKTIVLDIIETPGRIFQLNIYGAKVFYLAMIPTIVLNDIHDDHCPDDYLYCGSKYCIYHDLVCEGIIQCYPSSLICNDKTPSNEFLVLSFLAVVFSCLLMSMILSAFIFFKIRLSSRNDSRLISGSNLKPKLYGTVNCVSYESLPSEPLSKTRFYQNIQHYNELLISNIK
ncbi:comm domain-containing protein [Dermatophagoides farinae]|uniref:Comm domain-containing protein n=1 Tax=Dermatophagoides farinae TaxID=6954 RepID=A0A9D4SLH5_DERFA|nr:comm domain-containing protein [Dermatophagoides farinae]